MVYTPGNQTALYPRLKDQFTTTKQHFHDEPKNQEPVKTSTFGKLYKNSTYFLTERLEKKPTDGHRSTYKLGTEQPALTWSGRLPTHTYVGNGTFLLANGLTYSSKPVKLVPYNDLMKTEYQDHFTKKSPHRGYSVLNRTGYGTARTY